MNPHSSLCVGLARLPLQPSESPKAASECATPEPAGPGPVVAAVADWFGDSERNWTEDFAYENGNYGHVCRDCGKAFVGNKHRLPQCRKCAALAKAKWDAMTPEQQLAEENAALAWLKAHSPNVSDQPRGGQP